MDTAGEISVVIKFSPKREKLLENLKEQIKNSEQITSYKITKLPTTRWTVRASALLWIIENYSYIMELWNECLINENLPTEIKSEFLVTKSQMGKFDLFFALHLGHCLYSHTDNLSKSLQSWRIFQIFLQCCFENNEKKKNCHLFQSQSYPANVVHLIIPLLITLVLVVINKMRCTILIHPENTTE